MNIGISDKVLNNWIKDKEYITATDEGEAVAIAGGYYLATKKKATVFMSADGFMNTLNFLTSWIIPEDIGIHFIISIGRKESSHYVATEVVPKLLDILKQYESKNISYELMQK